MVTPILYRVLLVGLLSVGLLRPAAAHTPRLPAPRFNMAQPMLAPTGTGQPYPMGPALDARGTSYCCGQGSGALVFHGAAPIRIWPRPGWTGGADAYKAHLEVVRLS